MFVEAESGHAAQLHLLSQLLQARRGMRPVVERCLQGRRYGRGVGRARQVFRDNNKTPITGTVLKSGEFHMSAFFRDFLVQPGGVAGGFFGGAPFLDHRFSNGFQLRHLLRRADVGGKLDAVAIGSKK